MLHRSEIPNNKTTDGNLRKIQKAMIMARYLEILSIIILNKLKVELVQLKFHFKIIHMHELCNLDYSET